MKVLIRRKTILLSLLIALGLLAMSCIFFQFLPKELFETPTPEPLNIVGVLSKKTPTDEPVSDNPTEEPTVEKVTETPMLPQPTEEQQPEPTDSPTPEPTAVPTEVIDSFDSSKLGESDYDLRYCTADDGTELLMDLHYPTTNNGPWPVIFFVHHGGWMEGSKDRFVIPEYADKFDALVVTVNYRLSPAVKFPAHIEDVKCAVRHLRANAAMYNLDPERILAYGASAGGHLAALLGLTGSTREFDTGEYMEYSSAVQAVIAQSAPTNLPAWLCEYPESFAIYLTDVFDSTANCGDQDPKLIFASPVAYVDESDVPFLIMAGTADNIVPHEQSKILYRALKDAGVPSQLLLIENGKHSLVVKGESGWRPIVHETIAAFIIEQFGLETP